MEQIQLLVITDSTYRDLPLQIERRIVKRTDSIKPIGIQHDTNLPLYTV